MQITSEELTTARLPLLPPRSIATLDDCLAAVNRLGFAWAFTPGNALLPSLFTAMDTDREGQRWDWMWGWKDRMAESREAYYGKVIGAKPTLVSRQWLPVFYALTGNNGEPDDDLDHAGETKPLSDVALKVYAHIREFGPTGTRQLQERLTDGSKEMKNALEKALERLDVAMLIVKSGTEGGNSIANIWDLFQRFHPEAVEAGTEIATREAALQLTRQFFQLTPALAEKQVGRVFPWNEQHQVKAIARLVEAGELKACLFDGKPGYVRADFAATEATE